MKTYKRTAAPKSSPWGHVQSAKELAPGVWQVETAGHGGIKLSAERMKAMPEYLKVNVYGGGGSWFEEDCEWALVAVAFPEAFPEWMGAAFKTLQITELYRPALEAHKAAEQAKARAAREALLHP